MRYDANARARRRTGRPSACSTPRRSTPFSGSEIRSYSVGGSQLGSPARSALGLGQRDGARPAGTRLRHHVRLRGLRETSTLNPGADTVSAIGAICPSLTATGAACCRRAAVTRSRPQRLVRAVVADPHRIERRRTNPLIRPRSPACRRSVRPPFVDLTTARARIADAGRALYYVGWSPDADGDTDIHASPFTCNPPLDNYTIRSGFYLALRAACGGHDSK